MRNDMFVLRAESYYPRFWKCDSRGRSQRVPPTSQESREVGRNVREDNARAMTFLTKSPIRGGRSRKNSTNEVTGDKRGRTTASSPGVSQEVRRESRRMPRRTLLRISSRDAPLEAALAD